MASAEEIDMTATGEDDEFWDGAQGTSGILTRSNGKRGDDSIELAAGLPGLLPLLFQRITLLTNTIIPAEEAVLALVDFPKQIVVVLAVAVKYMKGESPRKLAVRN